MKSNTPLQNLLIMLLVAIFCSIVILTLILGFTGNLSRKKDVGVTSPSSPVVTAVDGLSVYTGLERLRLSSGDQSPVPIVLSAFFYYPTSDTAYYEELCTKNSRLKAVISGYFSSHSADELRKSGESTVKMQLLRLLNAELVLGSIDALYFSEYLFFE